MKACFLLAVLLTCAAPRAAQAQPAASGTPAGRTTRPAPDTTFFDGSWQHTNRANAVYFGWVTRLDSTHCLIQDFYLTGEKQMEAAGLPGPPVRKNGLATYYYRSGARKSAGQYAAGRKEGPWQYWSETGKLQRQATYVHDLARSRADTSRVVQLAEQMPVFPGGNGALQAYLATHVHYPAGAPRHLRGQVFIGFIVSVTGTIVNPRILKGINPACDAEALRAVAAMPRWKPGKQQGEPIAVRFVVPITFRS